MEQLTLFEIFCWFLFLWSAFLLVRSRRAQFRVEHLKSNSKNEIVIKIEELPGQVYLWDKDSEEFLAQGKDFDEAIDKCINRFPGTKFKVMRLVVDETSN